MEEVLEESGTMDSLENIAKAAAKACNITPEEAFEGMLKGIKKVPEQLQSIIDSIVGMQHFFPMPEDGWKAFVRDVEHTNKKHGLNLEIRETSAILPRHLAYEAYAAALDRDVESLTTDEKKQAIMNAILGAGKET